MKENSQNSSLSLEIYSTFCNSIDYNDFELNFNDTSSINFNIQVMLKKYNIFYGRVLNQHGSCKANILVNLVKYEKCCGTFKKDIISSCISDSNGEFNIVVDADKFERSNLKLEIVQEIDCNNNKE